MLKSRTVAACVALCSLLSCAAQQPGTANEAPLGPYGLDRDAYIVRYKEVFAPVVGRRGMVSTQSDIATAVGVDILRQGGNAIDASVAVGFALAVTLPRAGNLGGGGFMLSPDTRTWAPATGSPRSSTARRVTTPSSMATTSSPRSRSPPR